MHYETNGGELYPVFKGNPGFYRAFTPAGVIEHGDLRKVFQVETHMVRYESLQEHLNELRQWVENDILNRAVLWFFGSYPHDFPFGRTRVDGVIDYHTIFLRYQRVDFLWKHGPWNSKEN